jgi:serine protease
MATQQQDNGRTERQTTASVVRPSFRPRVIVKFRDYVDVPYEDGAEKAIIERYGGLPWQRLARQFPGLTLVRLFTGLREGHLRELIDEARQRDETYKPAKLWTWFTVDSPQGLRAQELASRLLEWEIVEKAYPDTPGADPVTPANDIRWPNQRYLDPACVGIDAEFAWTRAGGDGLDETLIDVEQGWTLNHEDLPTTPASLIYGAIVPGSPPHGTSVLGVICAVDNDRGCVGITPELGQVKVMSYSGSMSNVGDAIVTAAGLFGFGTVLLVEVETVFPPVSGAPAEIFDHVYEAIRLATALGLTVVEAAGNGPVNLDTFTHGGDDILNPASLQFRDSGAIIVGAASSTCPHSRTPSSSYGARVDCYAWGENVNTCTSDAGGTAVNWYTSGFAGTSAAAAMVAGAALAIQGITHANLHFRYGPAMLRNILREPATGTASANPAADRIGVMPNLRAIIETVLDVGAPDVYLRDNPGDIGDPHSGPVSWSPDIIVRQSPVADAQAEYGEGSGTENSTTLSYEVDASQNNYIYVRVRNRGHIAAVNATVTVYWSDVATLITPDMWNMIGQTVIPNVPTGEVLTVAGPIVWLQADIPASGHYCFVGLVDTAGDPAPTLWSLSNFDNFRNFIRNNNSATWRNFNVVASGASIEVSAMIAGAPDRQARMGIELIARLPETAIVHLAAPAYLLTALGVDRKFRTKGDIADIVMPVNGVRKLGEMNSPGVFALG